MDGISEIAKLSLLLEEKLSSQWGLDRNSLTIIMIPDDLQERLDGLIDNVAELEGLLRLGQAARQGEALSQPVVGATLLMLEELCEALFDIDELRAVRRLH